MKTSVCISELYDSGIADRGNVWTMNAPMNDTRVYGTAECWDGYVWAIGGRKTINGDKRILGMERHSIRDGAWNSGLLAGEVYHIMA